VETKQTISEGDGVYLRARREGVEVLWPESSDAAPWPPAAGSRPSWGLVDAASGDRLVRSPADGSLRVGEPPQASLIAPWIEGSLGPAAADSLLLPPPGQGGFEALGEITASEPVDLLFLASLRPFSDAEWAKLEPRLHARRATVLLGDLSAERRLPRDRGVVLVPGVSAEDVETALGLLTGAIARASSGRWGD
jgi:hypothetical protein